MADRTDGKKPKPINKFKRVPEGERVLVKLDIDDKEKGDVVSRMKEGTASLLGLKAITGIPKGQKGGFLRGAKGTKSFVLKLKERKTVGGAQVQRLHIPVPGTVGVDEFFKWAQKFRSKGVVGIITPHGVSYGFGIDLSDDK